LLLLVAVQVVLVGDLIAMMLEMVAVLEDFYTAQQHLL
jgi:hypothetical protein